MQDKWILVTGGSRGIGRATVLRLAKEWNVVFTWCQNESAAREVERACEGYREESRAINAMDAMSRK
jgi:3-oxoacyl-[acyl-carrier protein] reductase